MKELPILPIRPDVHAYAKLAVKRLGYVAGRMELTSVCDQKCAACDSWRPHALKATMPWEGALKALDDLLAMPTFEHLVFTGGDPRYWPDYERLLRLIAEKQAEGVWPKTAFQLISPQDSPLFEGEAELVRNDFYELCTSLDAVSSEVYLKMRGKRLDPEDVLARLEAIDHPRQKFSVCATSRNIHHIPAIFERLTRVKFKFRKVVVTAVMGDHDKGKNAAEDAFWEAFRALPAAVAEYGLPSNLTTEGDMEGPEAQRKRVEGGDFDGVRCWAGAWSFYIKANGDLYPCCLVGGEAIKTQTAYRIGNVFETPISALQKSYQPQYYYEKNPDGVDASEVGRAPICKRICQWKQAHANLSAESVAGLTFSMP